MACVSGDIRSAGFINITEPIFGFGIQGNFYRFSIFLKVFIYFDFNEQEIDERQIIENFNSDLITGVLNNYNTFYQG